MAKVRGDGKVVGLRRVIGFLAYLLVFWGFYRLIFKLPDEVEETIVKPILWLGPMLWIVFRKEKRGLASVGWTGKNFFGAVYWGLGLGMVFAVEGLLANFLKYGQFNFSNLPLSTGGFLAALGLSFVTAVSEETVFRGYVFTRLREYWGSADGALVVSSLSFALLYLPVTVLVLHYSAAQAVGYFLLLTLLGLGNGWVFARSGSVVAPIIVHSLWGWAVLLFR